VDTLFEELEESDRLQSIQIASFSVKLNKASLDTALISGYGRNHQCWCGNSTTHFRSCSV
jgi:hypothetical protein